MIWCSILTLLLAEPRHSVAFIPGLFHPCHSSSENKPGFGMDIAHIPISEMDWSMGRTYRTLQGCTKATYRKEWVSSRAPLGTFFMSYSGILINLISWNRKRTFQNKLRAGNLISSRSGPLAHSPCTSSLACHACLASVCLVRVLGQDDQKLYGHWPSSSSWLALDSAQWKQEWFSRFGLVPGTRATPVCLGFLS